MNGIFAAAGIAEAAWAMEACMLVLAFGIVGLLTLFAFALRSRHLAVFAAVLMLLGTDILPAVALFPAVRGGRLRRPDVESAAAMFRKVGIVWVATCVATVGSLLFAFLAARKGLPTAATPAAGPEGLPDPEHGVRSTGIQTAGEVSGVTLRESVFRAREKTDRP